MSHNIIQKSLLSISCWLTLLVAGVVGTAIELNPGHTQGDQYVNFGSHRDKCFGSLAHCPDGLTIAFWIMLWFEIDGGQHYYMSSGGPNLETHGIAFLSQDEDFIAMFKTPTYTWDSIHLSGLDVGKSCWPETVACPSAPLPFTTKCFRNPPPPIRLNIPNNSFMLRPSEARRLLSGFKHIQ